MNIDDALESMDEILDKAMQVPFSQKKGMVDVTALRDLIDDIRMNLPEEITQARNVINDRKVIISDAKQEADRIIHKAEERAARLVSQQEIIKQANDKASQILTNAQTKYNQLCNESYDYVQNMLTRLEELLSADMTDIKKAKSTLKRK